jgi:hypothetical protein
MFSKLLFSVKYLVNHCIYFFPFSFVICLVCPYGNLSISKYTEKHFRSEYCIAISILIDVLNKLFDVQNKTKWLESECSKSLEVYTSKLFFSSPDLKGYVSYCNHLASLIHKLFIFQPSSEEAWIDWIEAKLDWNVPYKVLNKCYFDASLWSSVVHRGHNSFWLGNISMIFLRTV